MPLSSTDLYIAEIDRQSAEIRLLRTRQGQLPPPPKQLGKNASKEELQQYVTDLDAYEAGVQKATAQGYQLDVLGAQKGLLKAQANQEGLLEQLKSENDEPEQNLYTRAANTVNQGKRRVGYAASRSNKWLANVPTPGGVWLPFGILMFLFLALFPINGHTRLKWLFLVLLGDAGLVDKSNNWETKQGLDPTITPQGTTITDVSSTNTNPNVSPGLTITSMPSPAPTQILTPLVVPVNDAGNTSYLSSLLSSFGEF